MPFDTTTLNPGAGGQQIVTDLQASGAQMPVSELAVAPDLVSDAKPVTPAAPLPVVDQDARATLAAVLAELQALREAMRDVNSTAIQGMDSSGMRRPVLVDSTGRPVITSSAAITGSDGFLARAPRYDRFGTQRTTSDTLLFLDRFSSEQTTINPIWSVTTSTMSVTQSGVTNGLLVLNQGLFGSGANSYGGVVNQRLFPFLPQLQLRCHFRAFALWPAVGASIHQTIELGFSNTGNNGSPTNQITFQFSPIDGGLYGVITNNSVVLSTPLLGHAAVSALGYCDYDIVVSDGAVRFLVCDSSGIPVVDQTVRIPTTAAGALSMFSFPTGARLFTDAIGGGTQAQLTISEHAVWATDLAMQMPWAEQSALSLRQAGIHPVSYAGASQAFGSSPSTLTPANGSAGYTTLGGEYAFATVVAAETPCSIFGFLVPTPYSFLLTGLSIPAPIVATTISSTGIPFIEWMIASNATSNQLSTGGGFRQGAGGTHACPTASAAEGSLWTGGTINWQPRVPIVCLPGTWLHIGFKILGATAVVTPGLHRGTVTVDGYFM